MCGGGIGCIDLDDALAGGELSATARAVLDATPGAWVELSQSGVGLHVFVAGLDGPGRRLTAADGTGVEVYARDRFIRMTGRVFRPGGVPVVDVNKIMEAVNVA
ncbi:hypothetical protein G7Y31_06725 [Corynebacterium lizhenjunii]|uniref:DNA primase n=1 Tax=Corynebacterium lizhenjunii TaxID=2709394 RepID=A0A7T0KCJ9_9CORY|nr:hypothetical protein [Corynebacterium lizhenjunii]QPK78278.1 hypothetical protein G7Y31_06725 [Corynebacterium lizhenjunii]